jgi:hypothetical protein
MRSVRGIAGEDMAYRSIFQDAIDSINNMLDSEAEFPAAPLQSGEGFAPAMPAFELQSWQPTARRTSPYRLSWLVDQPSTMNGSRIGPALLAATGVVPAFSQRMGQPSASDGVRAPRQRGLPAMETVTVRSPASQVERILDRNPRTSAGRELARTYWEMQDKNVPTTDQFFHCLGACRAVKKSDDKPRVLSMTRHKEYTDRARNLFWLYGATRLSPANVEADMAEDMTANTWGAACPERDSCNDRCAPFLDNLAPKYRPFMKKYRTTW